MVVEEGALEGMAKMVSLAGLPTMGHRKAEDAHVTAMGSQVNQDMEAVEAVARESIEWAEQGC